MNASYQKILQKELPEFDRRAWEYLGEDKKGFVDYFQAFLLFWSPSQKMYGVSLQNLMERQLHSPNWTRKEFIKDIQSLGLWSNKNKDKHPHRSIP